MRLTSDSPSLLRTIASRAVETAPLTPAAPGAATGAPFMSALTSAVDSVNQTQQAAATAAEQLATGQASNVHDVVVALEKADLALQLTVQTTQRAVEAYREISRMQV